MLGAAAEFSAPPSAIRVWYEPVCARTCRGDNLVENARCETQGVGACKRLETKLGWFYIVYE